MNWNQGIFEWHGMSTFDDDTEYQVIEDVTEEIRRLYRDHEALKVQHDKLVKEIKQIKTQRYWEEVDVYVDDRTGMAACVKTIFQYEPKTMRIEWDPRLGGDLGSVYTR